MSNNSFTTSTRSFFSVKNNNVISTAGESLDVVWILFDYLFTTQQTLKSQNIYLMLFIQQYVQQESFDILNKLLCDSALKDLHPSLLKSILLVTENVDNITESREKVNSIYAEKIQAY